MKCVVPLLSGDVSFTSLLVRRAYRRALGKCDKCVLESELPRMAGQRTSPEEHLPRGWSASVRTPLAGSSLGVRSHRGCAPRDHVGNALPVPKSLAVQWSPQEGSPETSQICLQESLMLE